MVVSQIESIKIKLEQIEEGGAEFEAEMKEYMEKIKKNQEYWAKFGDNQGENQEEEKEKSETE